MQDRYLFRGKRLDNEEWVEGFYWRIQNDDSSYDEYILLDITCHISNLTQTRFKIDPSTVGQCTGLRDKNGRLIFEGDIFLAGYYKWKCKVVRDEKCARFIGLTNDKDVKIVYVEMVDKHDISAVEVVGNIFDNPELLEVE